MLNEHATRPPVVNELIKKLQFGKGLNVGVAVDNDRVLLVFPKPVAWLGMSRNQARELADYLKQRASEL